MSYTETFDDVFGNYTPKMTDVVRRINALEGKQTGESHFYCSPECKELCPIYNKKESTYLKENSPYYEEKDNYRPYQQEWSQMVKEKANNKCEICGSTEDLVAHHIQPVKPCPHLQADVDNGVCLCQDCHYTHGHKDECSTGNLARMI